MLKGQAQAVQVIHELAGPEAVAYSEAGQAVGLGEGAQPHQGALLAHVFQAMWYVGVINKINVSFIQDHGDRGRQGVEKALPGPPGKHGAGGVVGAVQEDEPGVVADSLEDGFKVHGHVLQGDGAKYPPTAWVRRPYIRKV